MVSLVKWLLVTKEGSISWKDHIYQILNVNVSNPKLKCSIMDKLDDVKYVEAMVVSSVEVLNTISKLKCGKSAGPDGISAAYLM